MIVNNAFFFIKQKSLKLNFFLKKGLIELYVIQRKDQVLGMKYKPAAPRLHREYPCPASWG